MDRPTLLILDDDSVLLETLGRVLRKSYRVHLADCAGEAFRLLATEPIDMVLSDHHMPGMTGLEFLKAVSVRHADVLRILFTALPDAAMVIAAINQGDVFRVLAKPVALPELEVVLHLATERLQLDRENRILRSIVGRHPELEREFQEALARGWRRGSEGSPKDAALQQIA